MTTAPGSGALIAAPDSVRTRTPRLSFLVVGTPRSGTTVTQRLCCELPDVVMPPETHFLHLFAPGLLARRRFPLTWPEVCDELSRFEALPTSAGLRLDRARVFELLGPRCDRLIDLFSALVVALCSPPCSLTARYGEKTPEHLLWWRAMTSADPALRIVGVVRDPRAVAASHRAVPWGIRDPGELAEEWAFDQRSLRAARHLLGPRRCLVVRYEDLVAGPAACRARLADFLGVPPASASAPAGKRPLPPIVHSWEWWKARALEPVTTERRDLWRTVLTPAEAALVTQVAAPEMAAFGYLSPDDAGRCHPGGRPERCGPRLAARLRRMRALESVIANRPGR
ncbi:sulfotransferase [Microbispora sp. NEAU-D428]|uniref:sulfotransferase family protein n=1 Tax=Microbispora sitophila TaxID=2771537 RepID=UPI00186703FA|nr:sulfotransferase [Microbispora sitophila]MBE3008873.1 sulfotransferase [Microbispora sitophila]